MNTTPLREYTTPITNWLEIAPNHFCIGFGEGSIPPEDSDANTGWLEDEWPEEVCHPSFQSSLWDE